MVVTKTTKCYSSNHRPPMNKQFQPQRGAYSPLNWDLRRVQCRKGGRRNRRKYQVNKASICWQDAQYFLASSFSCSQAESTPANTQVYHSLHSGTMAQVVSPLVQLQRQSIDERKQERRNYKSIHQCKATVSEEILFN
jgi:hypothetical protein